MQMILWSLEDKKETFVQPETAAKQMGLMINYDTSIGNYLIVQPGRTILLQIIITLKNNGM
jgi:hypothetical protein